jgi:soluble P-type ATPase
MISIEIPGFGSVHLEHAVFDYNGTLACDGEISDQIRDLLRRLQPHLQIHILTADTFGKVKKHLQGEPLTIHILETGGEAQQKLAYIERLGVDKTICYGNGNNDLLMLKQARIGVAVTGAEGSGSAALHAAHVVVRDIKEGIGLLFQPLRLKATLRF